MNINLKKQAFIEDVDFVNITKNGLNRENCVKLSQLFINGIEKQLGIAEETLGFTKGGYDDSNFLKIINNLYDISLCEYKDYYNIFSIAYTNSLKPYNKAIINTYMVSNKFNYVNGDVVMKKKGTSYRVAYTDDFVKKDGRYTVEEIKKLIKDKKIIILEEYDDEIMFSEELYENYERIEPYKNYQKLSEDNFFYPCIIMYLRKVLTNEKIRKDVNCYLVDLKVRLNELLSDLSVYSSIKDECLKQLDKEKILFRLESLLNESKYNNSLVSDLNDEYEFLGESSKMSKNNHTLIKKHYSL